MRYLEETKKIWTRELIANKALSEALGIGLFTLLTALGAFVSIPVPFTPVPLTGQTFFVVLSGLFLKRYNGSISQFLYIGLGLIGLPLFAGAANGFSCILGPTGGYLIAFIFAPYLVNFCHSHIKSNAYIRAIAALSVGIAFIHLMGVVVLSGFMNIGIYKAFVLGSLPFLPGAFIKVTIGAKVYTSYKGRFN